MDNLLMRLGSVALTSLTALLLLALQNAEAAPPATTGKPGQVETASFTVLCPSMQDLSDIYRLINNGATDTALAYVRQKGCKNVDSGVALDLIERGPILSRVMLSHFTGLLSASTDPYFIRTIDLK